MRCPPFLLRTWLMLGCLLAPGLAGAAVVIVAHGNVRKLDVTQVQRIYTGRLVELAGQALLPVNQAPGSLMRQRFLNDYLQQDEDRYTAYWTVRRYVGKGTPPHEVRQTAEMIDYVSKTPGAIGYIDEADLPPGMNVVLRK